MSLIPEEQYADIIGILPILCVDVLIQNTSGQYLLVQRANEPKKGQWWPVGGRVLKGETLEQAVRRKVAEETSLQVRSIRPIGYFETVADSSPLGLSVQYHAVSVVFAAVAEEQQQVRLDDQSTNWKFTNEVPQAFAYKSFGE